MGSVPQQITLSRLIPLLRIHGFISESTVVLDGVKWPVHSYGTPGTLLRRNLQKEWWDYMVVKQKNTFPVSTSLISSSCLGDLGTFSSSPSNGADLSTIRTSLRPDLLSHVAATFQLMGGRLPFSLAQMGVCTNRMYDPKWEEKLLIGGLFNTEMISHYYCLPGVSSQAFDNWLSFRLRWWKQFCRSPSNFTTVDNGNQTNGHQSSRIEYLFPWGPETVETVTNEGDTAIQEKEKETQISLRVKSGRKDVLPHVIECKMCLEPATAAYLVDAFQEKQVFTASTKTSKEREPRQVLHLHRHLAPYKVAVATTGTRSRELRLVGSKWCDELRDSTMMILDTSDTNTTLELQFVRNDALGIPYTAILNDKTLDTGVASLRGRDTALKEQVHLTQVQDFIMRHIEPV
ncbi:DNA polymerase subunit gamma-2, mitochondrial-like [Gigantopelta aegis]|uniref:DNA polymerase subunit gamma-2, mitochondrial-like n=1 Tax=Gigantopelta aegis TaxID=1735272 RepID=UPI001B88AB96|nr:DNA polymerase subunit gamma-2, mitochondrial-like [Gigantopelta aegis]